MRHSSPGGRAINSRSSPTFAARFPALRSNCCERTKRSLTTNASTRSGATRYSISAVSAGKLRCTASSPGGSTHVNYKAFTGYAVGYVPIPVPFLDIFGKAGLARWSSSGSSSFGGPGLFSLSDSGTQFAWGIGAQVHVGNFGGRLEYENFGVRNTNGANLVSLGVFFNLF